jgi:hypothetical protein
MLIEDSNSNLDASAGAELDPDSDQDPAPSQKRETLPASLHPISKQVCTPAPTASPAPSDKTPLSTTPRHVITVTNNNRRSDVRIQQKIAKA